MPSAQVICAGMIERIGSTEAISTFKSQDYKIERICEIKNHKEGLERITALLLDSDKGVLNSTKEIDAIGHRVVHGGNALTETTLINNEVKNKIKLFSSLAPLHNPANLVGIEMAEKQKNMLYLINFMMMKEFRLMGFMALVTNTFLRKHQNT